MADIAKMMEEIKGMTVMELNSLVKALEEEFGVSAAAPVAVTTAPTGGEVAPAAEEKTEFNVVLKAVGDKKLEVIKVVKEVTGLGLVEAKNLVADGNTIKENVAKADAEKMAEKLKAAGATVELK